MDKKMIMHFYPPSVKDSESLLYVTWAGGKTFKSNQFLGFKTVDIYVLVYVISGRGIVYKSKKEALHVEAGSAFILFPGTRFRFSTDDENPLEIYWISFDGAECPKLLESVGIFKAHNAVHGLSENIRSVILNLDSQLKGDGMDSLAVIGSLLIIFSEIGNLQEKHSKRGVERKDIVPTAIRFIESFYFMHLDVDTLCAHVKYSRSYLSRLFNNELGITIPEYINKTRIEHAKRLFETTKLSVQDVSASVGIFDSFYFSKTFKKIAGVSPNQYKKRFSTCSEKSTEEK